MGRRSAAIFCVVTMAIFLLAGTGAGEGAAPSIRILEPETVREGEDGQRTLAWSPRRVELGNKEVAADLSAGREMAAMHCGRCHSVPIPSQLPRESWPFALTWMGNYVGWRNTHSVFDRLVMGDLVPDRPLLSLEELRQLALYYQVEALPEAEIRRRHAKRVDRITQFAPVDPPFQLPAQQVVTLAQFDEGRGRYYIGMAGGARLLAFDREGQLLMNFETESEPIDIDASGETVRLTLMGDLMIDRRRGTVLEMAEREGGMAARKLVEGYHRLVKSLARDIDGDGRDDLLLVGFGDHLDGRVSVVWGYRESGDERTILADFAGAVGAEILDLNGDDRLDILVLYAQDKQRLIRYINEGDRRFGEQTVLQEGVGFGFTSFDAKDFNGDGQADLLLTNGNNMELRDGPLKPYHGIRIAENLGDGRYAQRFRYQMYGALDAVAEDFDGDGDVDIAAIAFQPDWGAEEPETFVYLENEGGYQFRPYRLSWSDWGRWMRIAKADVNGDGYMDILLGGAYFPLGIRASYESRYRDMVDGRRSALTLLNKGDVGEKRP